MPALLQHEQVLLLIWSSETPCDRTCDDIGRPRLLRRRLGEVHQIAPARLEPVAKTAKWRPEAFLLLWF
jgi:hypothetical protein